MRIVFCGTPDFAVPSLQMLIDEAYDVVGVFCQPDRPVGRKQTLQAPPVKQLAAAHGIPVFQFEDMRKIEGVQALRALAPDLMLTAAFGQILSQENLDIPKKGTVNVHGSLLPQYRGAAPIQWAVIDGRTETGVTTLYTVLALDAGDMLLKNTLPIGPDETAGELFGRVATLGAQTLKQTIEGLQRGDLQATPQDEAQASKCRMLKKEDGRVDWSGSAARIHNLIRGLNPWPGAFTYVKKPGESTPQVMKIWRSQTAPCPVPWEHAAPGSVLLANPTQGLWVRTGEGALRLLEIQMTGGKRLSAEVFLRGHDLSGGVCLAKA